MRQFITLAAAAFMSLGAVGAHAATTGNIIFLVDESGSMGGDQAWLAGMVGDLDAAMTTAGVTATYGVVGFGATSPEVAPHTHQALADATTTAASLGSMDTSGGLEDGWAAMAYALTAFTFDAGAAINFVLVTDEDRDNVGGIYSTLTYASLLADLQAMNVTLNAVVDANYQCNGAGADLIGMDDSGTGYAADGGGGYTTCTTAAAYDGYVTTIADYVNLAIATGGAAWDLNILRSGGLLATSFTNAFIDIKVEEIVTTPGGVPIPGAVWLMAGGLGGLAALRRRKKAA